MCRLFFLFLLLVSFGKMFAQNDTVQSIPVRNNHQAISGKRISLDSCRKKVLSMSGLPLGKPGIFSMRQPKTKNKKSFIFYILLVELMFFAVLRRTFARYFVDVFRFFFRTSLKANQIREQLVQSEWQSFLFNLLFVVSTATFLALLADFYQVASGLRMESVLLVAIVGLLLIYTGKWCLLRIVGWLFQEAQLADMYIFIVFLVNKVMGILLLPFLVIMAFAPSAVSEIAVVVALIAIGVLLLYRFLLGYQAVFADSRLSRFHFLLYVLATEISPLLFLYRATVSNF